MLNSVNNNSNPYYDLYKYNNKKISSKSSFTDEILKNDKHKEEKVNDLDKPKQKDSEDNNITSKIITAGDGTRTLLLIKNSSIVSQINLGKAIEEFKEDNQKDIKGDNSSTNLEPSTTENDTISNIDTI